MKFIFYHLLLLVKFLISLDKEEVLLFSKQHSIVLFGFTYKVKEC